MIAIWLVKPKSGVHVRIRHRMSGGTDQDRVSDLIGKLESAKHTPPVAAMESLLSIGRPAVRSLIELLEEIEPDEDDWTPLWGTIVLGEMRSEEAVPFLIGLLDLPEGDLLSEAAVESLAKIGRPALPTLMEFAAKARSWEARHYAYSAIGLIPSEESLRFLLESLDRDALLWSSIAMSLADLDDKRALPALKILSARCDERESPALREAVNILEGRQPAYPRIHTQDWHVRYADILGR